MSTYIYIYIYIYAFIFLANRRRVSCLREHRSGGYRRNNKGHAFGSATKTPVLGSGIDKLALDAQQQLPDGQ